MTQYLLSPAARRDLEEIWDYSASNWGDDQAARYVAEIQSAVERLASGAIHGRSAAHIRRGYVSALVGSHVVYCRMSGDALDVIRILHQRMDVSRHIGKR